MPEFAIRDNHGYILQFGQETPRNHVHSVRARTGIAKSSAGLREAYRVGQQLHWAKSNAIAKINADFFSGLQKQANDEKV